MFGLIHGGIGISDQIVDELHGSSVVPLVIIEAFEAGGTKLRQADLDAIQKARSSESALNLQMAGGPGVRMKPNNDARTIPADELNASNDK